MGQVYLIALLVSLAAGPATYGVMWVKQQRATAVAYQLGTEAGVSLGRTQGLKEATATKAAIAKAERETPLLAKKEAIAACKKENSCREKAQLK